MIRSVDGRQLDEEIEYAFEQARIVIGRGAGADVRIPHRTVSELHAIVQQDDGAHFITDQDSTNGTRVNGERLVAGRRRKLADGDRIETGIYLLRFHTGQVVTKSITAERTSELARRLLRARREAEAGLTAMPRLVIVEGQAVGSSMDIPPAPARLLVGRDPQCQLRLDDDDVSRLHMEVIRDLDGVEVRDLDSKNGIELGTQRLSRRRLQDGDELRLGNTLLLFEEPAEESIRAMSGEPDEKLSADYWTREQTPLADETPSPRDQPAQDPEAPRRKAKQGAELDADLIIYALAALVFALSIAGLMILVRG